MSDLTRAERKLRRQSWREGAQGPWRDPSPEPPGAGTGDPTQCATPMGPSVPESADWRRSRSGLFVPQGVPDGGRRVVGFSRALGES